MMNKFLIRILALVIPFAVILALYVVIDPHKAFRHYDQYYLPSDFTEINRGYASTCMYDNNYKKYHYDSFIFGNSRSLIYNVDEWKKYIPSESSCFHFDCSGGCVEDLYRKVKYINEHGEHISNALFVVDSRLLSRTFFHGMPYLIAPQLVDYDNYVEFQCEHIKAFMHPYFLASYSVYYFLHDYKEFMAGYVLKYHKSVNPVTNEIKYSDQDSLIQIGEYYTPEFVKIFNNVQYPDSISPISLNDERKELLSSMNDILKMHNTNFKIIISPSFDQIHINPNDLEFLKVTFGNENVFDFSGPNKWNADYHNYYETTHYRPNVAYDIMQIIYQ